LEIATEELKHGMTLRNQQIKVPMAALLGIPVILLGATEEEEEEDKEESDDSENGLLFLGQGSDHNALL
jgi:hypothetical protein